MRDLKSRHFRSVINGKITMQDQTKLRLFVFSCQFKQKNSDFCILS